MALWDLRSGQDKQELRAAVSVEFGMVRYSVSKWHPTKGQELAMVKQRAPNVPSPQYDLPAAHLSLFPSHFVADISIFSHSSHFFPPYPKPSWATRQQKAEHNFTYNFPTRFCPCPSLIKIEMKPAKKVISSSAEGQKTGH